MTLYLINWINLDSARVNMAISAPINRLPSITYRKEMITFEIRIQIKIINGKRVVKKGDWVIKGGRGWVSGRGRDGWSRKDLVSRRGLVSGDRKGWVSRVRERRVRRLRHVKKRIGMSKLESKIKTRLIALGK
jgi:hypothetical protein